MTSIFLCHFLKRETRKKGHKKAPIPVSCQGGAFHLIPNSKFEKFQDAIKLLYGFYFLYWFGFFAFVVLWVFFWGPKNILKHTEEIAITGVMLLTTETRTRN